MTSERRLAANRANAAKSTGPRSSAGKAVARFNAWAHGLAAPASSEPGADREILGLARAIVEEAGREDLLGLAIRVAEADIDLRRIRRAGASAEPPRRADALERYERRASSRRKSAVRAFDAARRLPPIPGRSDFGRTNPN